MGKKNRRPRREHCSNVRPVRGFESIVIPLPNGGRALYVGDALREDDPPEVREGIARRRVVATTGVCPCGARVPIGAELAPPVVAMGLVIHAIDCPAAEENLAAAMRRADR